MKYSKLMFTKKMNSLINYVYDAKNLDDDFTQKVLERAPGEKGHLYVKSLISIKNRDYINVFITSENIKHFIENTKTDGIEDSLALDIYKKITKGLGGIAIHMPDEKHSVFYNIREAMIFSSKSGQERHYDEDGNMIITGITKENSNNLTKGAAISKICFNNFDYVLLNPAKRKDFFIDYINNNIDFKRFINILLYINTFEDCIFDGTPNEHSAPGKKSIKILETEHIKHAYKNGVTPHIRSGHFRRFMSDRYINVKNKTIYIKSTMVNGRAKHVK